MDPQIYAARKYEAQCGLREGARLVAERFGNPEILPDIPAVAQRVNGHKRDVQILQQNEAIAQSFATIARILHYLEPATLAEVAECCARDLRIEAELDEAAAPEEEPEAPESETPPHNFGSTNFDGFLEYTVLVDFTIQGAVTPDGPMVDNPVVAGQRIMLEPEAATAWLGGGLIRLSDPQPGAGETETPAPTPAIVSLGMSENPRLCYEVLKEIEHYEAGSDEVILFPADGDVSIYLTDEEAAPHVETGHLRLMDPQPSPVIAEEPMVGTEATADGTGHVLDTTEDDGKTDPVLDEVAAITPTDNPADPPVIPDAPVLPEPVQAKKSKNKNKKGK